MTSLIPRRRRNAAAARASGAPAGLPPGRVRIIGGRYRRTPLPVLDLPGLRPTPDRVRVTVFNWLEHLLGTLEGRRALDLFAGSGALGLEMASRGATEVLLVDHHPAAAAALRALADRLGASAVRVMQADWRSACGQLAPGSFDVVFLDPPYAAGLLPEALPRAARLLAAGGLIYLETAQQADAALWESCGLQPVRSGQAGAVRFHLLRTVPC